MIPHTAIAQDAALRARELSSKDLVLHYLARLEAKEQEIGAFLSVRPRGDLLEEAKRVDDERILGRELPAFAGVPIAIKDNIAMRGEPMTCGSQILANYRSPYDATVVTRLKKHRLVILGKTNMDEFGFGSSTENSAFHVTSNPVDLSRVPGGTSGGSAAAVAAGLAPWALGSDTGGSVRQPASLCGVVGHRPSYGRVSRYGLAAYASSMDCIGPIARSVGDVSALLRIIEGRDIKDATSTDFKMDGLLQTPPRVGIIEAQLADPCQTAVANAIHATGNAAASMGWSVKNIRIPSLESALATYYIIASVEAASNLARYDGIRYGRRAATPRTWQDLMSQSRTEGLGREARRRIVLGTFAASAGYSGRYYERARMAREQLIAEHAAAFRDVDIMLSPVSPTTAWKKGEKTEDPMSMYMSDVMSIGASLAMTPATVFPGGVDSEGLPIGVQVTGPRGADHDLLAIALKLQERLMETQRPAPSGDSSATP